MDREHAIRDHRADFRRTGDLPATLPEGARPTLPPGSPREKKDTAVYVLTRFDDAPHKLTASSGGSGETRFSDRSAELTDGDIPGLVATLSQIVDRPVVDETGIGDRYDISLRWTSGDVGSLKAAVKEKLGLKLADATRPIEFLVIDRVEKLQ